MGSVHSGMSHEARTKADNTKMLQMLFYIQAKLGGDCSNDAVADPILVYINARNKPLS